MKDFKRTLIAREAEKQLRKLGEVRLPVDVKRLASELGILVQPADRQSDGWSGMLVHTSGQFGIVYATNIDNEGFQRFSIGHELGHYCLPGHHEHVVPVDGVPHFSYAGHGGKDDFEREADAFAACLLMPSEAVAPLTQAEPCLEAVEALAEGCGASLASAGSRFAELSPAAVVVVLSQGDRVVRAGMSRKFKNLPDVSWLKAGAPVPKGTATWRASRVATPTRMEDATDFDAWFGGGPEGEIIEEAILLGSYGRTLTVLVPQGIADEDDEPEQEEVEPTFHRSRRR